MMILFSAPILTRILARKRAYEYLQYDSGRRELMKTAGIELHAHDAFDHEGNPVSLHRYRHVEVEQSIIQKYYESKRFETNEKLKRQTEAVSRLI
jgi:hypothetical protein